MGTWRLIGELWLVGMCATGMSHPPLTPLHRLPSCTSSAAPVALCGFAVHCPGGTLLPLLLPPPLLPPLLLLLTLLPPSPTAQQVAVCVFAFDCLSLNGRTLLREPLTARREALYSALNESEGHLQFATAKVGALCASRGKLPSNMHTCVPQLQTS